MASFGVWVGGDCRVIRLQTLRKTKRPWLKTAYFAAEVFSKAWPVTRSLD